MNRRTGTTYGRLAAAVWARACFPLQVAITTYCQLATRMARWLASIRRHDQHRQRVAYAPRHRSTVRRLTTRLRATRHRVSGTTAAWASYWADRVRDTDLRFRGTAAGLAAASVVATGFVATAVGLITATAPGSAHGNLPTPGTKTRDGAVQRANPPPHAAPPPGGPPAAGTDTGTTTPKTTEPSTIPPSTEPADPAPTPTAQTSLSPVPPAPAPPSPQPPTPQPPTPQPPTPQPPTPQPPAAVPPPTSAPPPVIPPPPPPPAPAPPPPATPAPPPATPAPPAPPPAPAPPAWVNPMPGVRLSSCFGPRWGTVHQGIDFAGPNGTPILATGAGTVFAAGWLYSGYGISVVVDHGNGFLSHYAHAQKTLVSPGQTVAAGQPIALEGSTGDSTGPHLHFEIHQGLWNQINPAPWLRARGVQISC